MKGRLRYWIILLALIYFLAGCTVKDYSYLNSEPKMYRVSERYSLEWKLEKVVKQEVFYNLDLLRYRDTTIFPVTCPDPHIEVRYYKTN